MVETSQLIFEQAGDATVVRFDTNNVLDGLQIQTMGQRLAELVERQGRRLLVLDFSKVTLLSSQAIGMLLAVRQKALSAKAEVLLCAIRPDLREVFRITRIEGLFKFYDTPAAALAEPGAGKTR